MVDRKPSKRGGNYRVELSSTFRILKKCQLNVLKETQTAYLGRNVRATLSSTMNHP